MVDDLTENTERLTHPAFQRHQVPLPRFDTTPTVAAETTNVQLPRIIPLTATSTVTTLSAPVVTSSSMITYERPMQLPPPVFLTSHSSSTVIGTTGTMPHLSRCLQPTTVVTSSLPGPAQVASSIRAQSCSIGFQPATTMFQPQQLTPTNTPKPRATVAPHQSVTSQQQQQMVAATIAMGQMPMGNSSGSGGNQQQQQVARHAVPDRGSGQVAERHHHQPPAGATTGPVENMCTICYAILPTQVEKIMQIYINPKNHI